MKEKVSFKEKFKSTVLTAETLRYIICGFICGVVVNMGVYYLLANVVLPRFDGFLADNANAIGSASGWILATVLTFVANKYIVFRSKETKFLIVLKEFFGTVGARGFSFFISTFGMKLFVDMNIFGIALLQKGAGNEYLDKNGALIAFLFRCLFGLIEIIFNYVMNKFLIFADKSKPKNEE